MNHVSVNIRQSPVGSVVANGQSFMVDPQQVQDRGVKVVGCGDIPLGTPGPGIALAVGRPGLDAGSCQPADEGSAIVIPTFTPL